MAEVAAAVVGEEVLLKGGVAEAAEAAEAAAEAVEAAAEARAQAAEVVSGKLDLL